MPWRVEDRHCEERRRRGKLPPAGGGLLVYCACLGGGNPAVIWGRYGGVHPAVAAGLPEGLQCPRRAERTACLTMEIPLDLEHSCFGPS